MASSSASDAKQFIDAATLQHLSEDLAAQVARANYRPTFLIALWRGGCAPGAVVQEFLEYVQRSRIDHVAVRTVSRDAKTGAPLLETQVHAVGHALKSLCADDRLLIVDDVWDRGSAAHAVLDHLREHLHDTGRMPREVRVATVFYKPKRNKYTDKPDFYVLETDAWLVFPHELTELTEAEVAQYRPHAHALAQALLRE